MIIEAYYRGLLSKDECTKILGIDPTILIDTKIDTPLFQTTLEQHYIQ